MTENDVSQIVRHIADLRMQVSALQVAAKNESLPESVKQTRMTIRWSALLIAAALIASSLLKYCGDERVHNLERRVEALEHYGQ